MRSFDRRLLDWYAQHGRRDLPWQRDPTPYRVWISEIMLQQTQVATVQRYYERFIARCPDVNALASASLDEVLALWSGLGYYARARHLHRAARKIVARHGGDLPRTIADLEALPGIGRSTAGAILALSRNERHPILDGNVRRVLARHAGVTGWPGAPAIEAALWTLAAARTPEAQAAAYTQAIMDLGATVCRRRAPACDRCPVSEDCVAHRSQRVHELPTARPRTVLPLRRTRFVMAIDAETRILLESRPPSGLWGGLWSFPECAPDDDLARHCERALGFVLRSHEDWPIVRHGFTHFVLEILPSLVRVGSAARRVGDVSARRWCTMREARDVGLAAPVSRLLERITTLIEASR